MSPIPDIDGDELDDELEEENIVADPLQESCVVLGKNIAVDPPAHQPTTSTPNIPNLAINDCDIVDTVFTQEGTVITQVEIDSGGQILTQENYNLFDPDAEY